MQIDVANIRRWADEIRELTGDDTETFLDTLDGQTDALDILTQLVTERAFAAEAQAAAKAMAETFTARAKRMADKQASIARVMGEILDAMGEGKVTLPIATISRTKPRTGVEITDEHEVPSQLMRIKRSPDLTAIKEHLLAGESVPGAQLKTGEPGLTVRIK